MLTKLAGFRRGLNEEKARPRKNNPLGGEGRVCLPGRRKSVKSFNTFYPEEGGGGVAEVAAVVPIQNQVAH